MSADVIYLPTRDRFLDLIEEALAQRPPTGELFTDGVRVAWLPRRLPGWWPVSAALIKEAA